MFKKSTNYQQYKIRKMNNGDKKLPSKLFWRLLKD